jgi:hypothetical protein
MDVLVPRHAAPRRVATALVAVAAVVLALATLLVAPPAHAVPAITVSVGSPVSGAAGTQIPITSVQVSGSGTTPVQLRVTSGTLSMTTTTGLAFTGASTGATLQFSGTVADVNAALSTLRYTRAGAGTDTLEVALIQPGEIYWPTNGHLYARMAGPYDWPTSNSQASASTRAGAQGYLVALTSSAEEAFVAGRLGVPGWIGGTDSAVEGTWVWAGGPEAGQQFWQGTAGGTVTGYAHWHPIEPNAFNPFEDCAVLYTDSLWNDSSCSAWGYNGYYVEYGAPGALPDLSVASLGITTLAAQSIGFTGPAGGTFGTPVPLSATATSGLTVAFASTTPAVCTVTGATVAPVAAGSCTIEATQGGNGTYAAATPVGQTFTIAKAAQAIAATAPGALAVGDDATVSGTATSGQPVAFSSTTPSVCSIAGGTVSGLAVGTCTLDATVAGDTRYEPATSPVTIAVGATLPGAPRDVAATSGEASVTVAFSPPAFDGGADVTGYRVSVSPSGHVVTATSSPVTVTGLQPGVPVTVSVRATNGVGDGPAAQILGYPGDIDQGFLVGGRLISGGSGGAPTPVPADAVGVARAATGSWVALASGDVVALGGAPDLGGVDAPAAPVVDIAATPTGDGYWLVDASGDVDAFGTAIVLGDVGDTPLNARVTALAPAPDGAGYWIVASDGGVFAFGSAAFTGSAAQLPLQSPIIGILPSPTAGYRLVAADGGVFTYGDAPFLGSAAGLPLQAPIVAAVTTPSRAGYYLVGADGGVFTYGDARFRGSASDDPGAPVAGLRLTSGGYDLVRTDGTIESFTG